RRPRPAPFPYTTLFRSELGSAGGAVAEAERVRAGPAYDRDVLAGERPVGAEEGERADPGGGRVGELRQRLEDRLGVAVAGVGERDRKSTRLNSSHSQIS